MCISDSKVLKHASALEAVEQALRAMSKHNHVVITSESLVCAEVIAEVAADWVSRLLGDAYVTHLASCRDQADVKAVHLIVINAVLLHVAAQPPFHVECSWAFAAGCPI